jgi:hypothetical protein
MSGGTGLGGSPFLGVLSVCLASFLIGDYYLGL